MFLCKGYPLITKPFLLVLPGYYPVITCFILLLPCYFQNITPLLPCYYRALNYSATGFRILKTQWWEQNVSFLPWLFLHSGWLYNLISLELMPNATHIHTTTKALRKIQMMEVYFLSLYQCADRNTSICFLRHPKIA